MSDWYRPGPEGSSAGSPLQGPSSSTSVNPWMLVGVAAVVLCLAAGALTVVLLDRGSDAAAGMSTTTSSTTSSTSTTTTSMTTAPATTTSVLPVATHPTVVLPPTTEAPAEFDSDAESRLDDQIAEDAPQVEQLLDVWVPQLSAKRPGLDVKGDDRGAYTAAAVLSDHLAYRQRYADQGIGVLLLRSSDYNFKSPGFYVTVVDETFATPEAANAWCDGQGIGPDDCFAKRLSHSDGWHGSTLSRG
jgi:serine/threonine-protein kinase